MRFGSLFSGALSGTAAAIAGAVGVAALTVLYLLRMRRREVVVPFAPLWLGSRAQQRTPFWARRLRHWLSLAAGADDVRAHRCWRPRDPRAGGDGRAGRSVVILIDRSASMSARDEPGSRLAAARARATAIVDGPRGPHDRALVASFAADAVAESGFEADARAAAPRGRDGRRQRGAGRSAARAGVRRRRAARPAAADHGHRQRRWRSPMTRAGSTSASCPARTPTSTFDSRRSAGAGTTSASCRSRRGGCRRIPASVDAAVVVQNFAAKPLSGRGRRWRPAAPPSSGCSSSWRRASAGGTRWPTCSRPTRGWRPGWSRRTARAGDAATTIWPSTTARSRSSRRCARRRVLVVGGARPLSGRRAAEPGARGHRRSARRRRGRGDARALGRLRPGDLRRRRARRRAGRRGVSCISIRTAPAARSPSAGACAIRCWRTCAATTRCCASSIWRDVNIAEARRLVLAPGDVAVAGSFGVPLIVARERDRGCASPPPASTRGAPTCRCAPRFRCSRQRAGADGRERRPTEMRDAPAAVTAA